MDHPDANAIRSPEQPIKRTSAVYGKRSNRLSSPSTLVPVDEKQQRSESRRIHHALCAPPQQRRSSPSTPVHGSDSERSHSPDAVEPFQFGFRHQLKELDEEFDHRDAQSCTLGRSSSSEVVHVGLSQVKVPQSVSMGTAILSPEAEARPSSGNLPPTSLPPSPAPPRVASESPQVHRRARRVTNTVPSDSEAEGQSKSSSVSPVRHAITTPHSRSSPTPPTSGEIQMVNRKTKGKAPARDVLPLVFDGELPLIAELPTKSKKAKRNETLVRTKTKAPTKKERREAALESSRIAASRSVDVTRTQDQKHTLSAFFAGLRHDNIVTPTLGAELSSDPIEKFSSPTDRSTPMQPMNSMFGAPTRILKTSDRVGTSNSSFSSERIKALPPAAGGSDDEMPSVTSIIQASGASGRQHRLQAVKRAALQQADTSITLDIKSEDDDLLIVKDDMHAVAREEAAKRRLDKTHGSPVKDMATLRRINHPSVRRAVVSPHKFSKQELEELAKSSFARERKTSAAHLTKKQLDQWMMMQHTDEQLRSIKRHEEEWIKGGGRLSRDVGGDAPRISLSQQLGAYAELGLKAVETDGARECEASADDSDEDYTPDLRGSASPKLIDADEGDSEPSDNVEIPQVPQSQVNEEEDEEEIFAPSRRIKSGLRHPRVVVGSDDEGEEPVHGGLSSMQRDSTSSMESQTEDENDKENSAKLMYDRSEDKENKAIVRHEAEMASGSRLGSLHGAEDGIRGSVSRPFARDFNDMTSSPESEVRPPLKDISRDERDLFLSASPGKTPFTDGLLRTSGAESPPILRSERVGRINRLSLDLANDKNDPSGFGPLQPSFLERLHSQISPEPSLAPINPLPNGGFSQLFCAEDRSSTKLVNKAESDELSLTLDVGLKPALEVSGSLRRKAETIFEKEQEYVVAAAVRNDRPKEHLYVNDHGFLTQTRPEGSSPQVYRMTPSQASKFIGTQVRSTQTQPPGVRAPLRTLSFTVSPELTPEPQRLMRLRRRSPSPLAQKSLGKNDNLTSKLNAFDILGRVLRPSSEVQREKLGKSEFVAVEAEESDEDDMFGFGGPKKGDEEEEEEDQDKVVEGLVDDAVMNAETEAADLVLEKHREHEEEEDQRLQKLHQDAIEGKFRVKRRGREVGFEDDTDEDDDDDDDDAHRIRQRIHKKRKIEGDSLEALGQNEETRAFYNTYHQDLIDEDDEFAHLREDAAMPPNDDDARITEREEQETVSVDEIRQRMREVAQSNLEVEELDPEDTSWIDQSMMNDVDDAVHVKVVQYRRSKHTVRHTNTGQMDFDAERPMRDVEDEQERNQLKSWAKHQKHRHQGTGRSGNSAAVTGRTRVKTGGGSLISAVQPSNATAVRETRKTKKTSSLLSTVPGRSERFRK